MANAVRESRSRSVSLPFGQNLHVEASCRLLCDQRVQAQGAQNQKEVGDGR